VLCQLQGGNSKDLKYLYYGASTNPIIGNACYTSHPITGLIPVALSFLFLYGILAGIFIKTKKADSHGLRRCSGDDPPLMALLKCVLPMLNSAIL